MKILLRNMVAIFLLSLPFSSGFIDIHSPQDDEIFPSRVLINISLFDEGFSFVSFDGGLTNISMNESDGFFTYSSEVFSSDEYQATIFAIDLLNTTYTEIRNFSVDKLSPIITVVSPSSLINKSSFFLEVISNEELSQVLASINDGPNQSFSQENETGFRLPLVLSDGEYSVDLFAFDSVNNMNGTQINISIDTLAPVISSVSLDGGDILSTPLLNASAFISDRHLANVSFFMDEELFYFNDSGVNGTYRESYPSIDGDYSWKIFAKDLFGNLNEYLFNFSVDIDEPSPFITIDDNVSGLYSEPFPIFVEVTDEDEVHLVEYRLENDSHNFSYYEIDFFESDVWYGLVDISSVSDGSYGIRVRAFDSLDNNNSKKYIGENITIDTIDPNVSNFTLFPQFPLISNKHLNFIDTNISLITDETIVYYRYEVFYNDPHILLANDSFLSFQTESFDFRFEYALTVDGTYTVCLFLSDLAGNEVKLIEGDIIIDTNPPIINTSHIVSALYPFMNPEKEELVINISSNEFPLDVEVVIHNNTDMTSFKFMNMTHSSLLNISLSSNFSQGEYEISLFAFDWLNHSSNMSLGNISLDSYNPNISLFSTNLSDILNMQSLFSINFSSNEFLKELIFAQWYTNNSLAYTSSLYNISSGFTSANISLPDTLEEGNYSINFSFIDMANNTFIQDFGILIYDRLAPSITISDPKNASISYLAVPFIANSSEGLSFASYSLNGGSAVDMLGEIDESNKINTTIVLSEYGSNTLNITLIDMVGKNTSIRYNFTAPLVISEFGQENDTDGDGILDNSDMLIGSEDNIYSNYFDNLSLEVNDTENLSQLFSDNVNVSIFSHNQTLLTFENNFSHNEINLTSVVLEFYLSENNQSTFIVQGIDLEENKTKTVYFPLSNTSSTIICLIDSPRLDISTILNHSCTQENMTLVSSIPFHSEGYNVTFADSSNDTVKISGLQHSAIQEVCIENWSCTSFSYCSGNLRSRVCVDTNACGTQENKPIEEQSCSSGRSGSRHEIQEADLINVSHPKNSTVHISLPGFPYDTSSKNMEEDSAKEVSTEDLQETTSTINTEESPHLPAYLTEFPEQVDSSSNNSFFQKYILTIVCSLILAITLVWSFMRERKKE